MPCIFKRSVAQNVKNMNIDWKESDYIPSWHCQKNYPKTFQIYSPFKMLFRALILTSSWNQSLVKLCEQDVGLEQTPGWWALSLSWMSSDVAVRQQKHTLKVNLFLTYYLFLTSAFSYPPHPASCVKLAQSAPRPATGVRWRWKWRGARRGPPPCILPTG